MHGPGDVVADGQVVQHVPDQHAHVVVAEERQTRHVQPRPLLRRGPEGPAVRRLRIRRVPRLAPRVDADRVTGLEPDAPLAQDVLQLPAVDGSLLRHARDGAVARHVEQHAARDDPLGPVLDRSERRPIERDLPLRIAAVPHRLVVPGVAERVDVRRGHAVVEDAVVVGGEPALAARERAHVVLRGEGVVEPRLLREGPAQRDGAPAAHQSRRRHALGRRDEVERADLVVRPPASPVPAVANVAAHVSFRG